MVLFNDPLLPETVWITVVHGRALCTVTEVLQIISVCEFCAAVCKNDREQRFEYLLSQYSFKPYKYFGYTLLILVFQQEDQH